MANTDRGISRRTLLKAGLQVAGGVALTACGLPTAVKVTSETRAPERKGGKDMSKPNILFIFNDQHRHDVMGCAGHPLVQTPNLDRIAGDGARFSRTWCQSPVCQPSRASVITGRYTEDLDIYANTRDFDPEWPTVMQSLQSAGYETATVGKTHYHGYPSRETLATNESPYDLRNYSAFVKRFGWDYVLEEYDKYAHLSPQVRSPYTDYLQEQGLLEEYRKQIRSVYRLTPTHWRGETSRIPQEHDLSSFIGDHAMNWLSTRDDSKPFFLKLAFVQPHVPLIDDPIWADHYRAADIVLPEQQPAVAPNDAWQTWLDVLNKHSQVQTMDEAFIRNGIRHYLGMVSLIDQKIGEVVALLESQGQLDNTWIVYSSDHGEMLGEHHLWAKLNFYEGSVQVPLIVRPPAGGDGRVVEELVELTDVTATLADIGGVLPPAGCRGASLLPTFTNAAPQREFARSRISSYSAVRNSRYRFTMEVKSGTPCELFDLEADPGELTNLINESGYSSTIRQFREVVTGV